MQTNTQNQGLRMQPGLSLQEKVIQHVTLTDSALQKAAAMEKTAAAKQAAVATLIPQVVDTMVKFNRVDASQREKLAAMLADPVQALQLMIKVAGHRNAEELGRLGMGVTQTGQVKTAGSRPQYNPADSLTSPHVGARTTRVKQSSVSLFQGLGLSAPSEG